MCRKMVEQLKIQTDTTMDFGLVLDREEMPAQKGLGVGLGGEFNCMNQINSSFLYIHPLKF